LEREVALLDRVRVVIALGGIAREAWLRAAGWWDRLPPGERPLFGHGAVATLPDGTVFIASYHPSRQNTNTGRLTKEMWYEPFRLARRRLT
jgi:uracil-DNA glycosylase